MRQYCQTQLLNNCVHCVDSVQHRLTTHCFTDYLRKITKRNPSGKKFFANFDGFFFLIFILYVIACVVTQLGNFSFAFCRRKNIRNLSLTNYLIIQWIKNKRRMRKRIKKWTSFESTFNTKESLICFMKMCRLIVDVYRLYIYTGGVELYLKLKLF